MRDHRPKYAAVCATTGTRLRKNYYFDPRQALAAGYAWADAFPGRDFRVVDEAGLIVPGSRIKGMFNPDGSLRAS